MVENCDIMLEILHKHNPFEKIRDPDNCDVRAIFLWRFFTWPNNYYNDNNQFQTDFPALPDSFISLALFYSGPLRVMSKECVVDFSSKNMIRQIANTLMNCLTFILDA